MVGFLWMFAGQEELLAEKAVMHNVLQITEGLDQHGTAFNPN